MIEGIERKTSKWFDVIREIKQSGRETIIFGIGDFSELLYTYLRKYGVDILCFSDTNTALHFNKIHGKWVISFEEMKERYIDCNILIAGDCALNNWPRMQKRLKKNGFLHVYYYAFLVDCTNPIQLLPFEYSYYDYVKANEKEFDEVFAMLSDERSREVFKTKIEFNMTGDLSLFPPIVEDSPQYFDDDIIKYNDHEVFIDCGAFVGDTFEAFMKSIEGKGQLKKYYAMEPDPTNYKKLLDTLFVYPNTVACCFGVALERTEQHFTSMAAGSIISADGDLTIKTISIDELLRGEECTFIKMDVQGFEMESLEGAKETIAKYAPKLAISAYHNVEDIMTIPLQIKRLNPRYNKFYFRHYKDPAMLRPYTAETVFYAIAE